MTTPLTPEELTTLLRVARSRPWHDRDVAFANFLSAHAPALQSLRAVAELRGLYEAAEKWQWSDPAQDDPHTNLCAAIDRCRAKLVTPETEEAGREAVCKICAGNGYIHGPYGEDNCPACDGAAAKPDPAPVEVKGWKSNERDWPGSQRYMSICRDCGIEFLGPDKLTLVCFKCKPEEATP